VAGIRAALDQAQAELNARIAALTRFEETTASAGPPPPATSGAPKPKPKPKPLFTGQNLNVPSVGVMGFNSKPFKFGFRANGGPVTQGNPFVVGERGPELFIPSTDGQIISNNKMNSGAVYNITVNAGLGTDGAAVGRQIVDAIKRFERTSGPVFASA
jgi:hypothetical protein